MIDDPTPANQEEQLVIFRLGDDFFAISIASVNEIIRMQKITPVPKAPSFVEGVTDLRGRVIPVIDLRRRFGVTPRADGSAGRIVVVEEGDRLLGMIVDAVDEVLTVPAESIEPVDEMVVSVDAEFLSGIVRLEDRLIILLDKEQVLSAGESQQLGRMKVPSKVLKQMETQSEEALDMLPSGR
jgi:purine-binding chemotaxis protein CheW